MSANYMFGSILAMSREDVLLSIVLSCIVHGVVRAVLQQDYFAITFDESFARANGDAREPLQ